MSKVIKVILLGVLILFIAWIGVNVYSCLASKPADLVQNVPEKTEATYKIYVKNTGTIILSSDYEQSGSQVGSRIFILNGFWELQGNEFIYKNGDVVLREDVFGVIEVTRR